MPTQSSYTRKTYYVSAEDEQAIAAIRERHGHATDSSAVRYAIRRVNALERKQSRERAS